MVALKIDKFMDLIHARTTWLTYSGPYIFVSSIVILLNPVSLAPQVYRVFTAPSVEGISPTMWIIFAFVQLALLLEGIKMKKPALFFSMLVSILESLTILTVVMVRS